MTMDNSPLIAALEQARAALDSVEAAATQNRRDKLSKPPQEPVASEPCPNCGKGEADCACEDDAEFPPT